MFFQLLRQRAFSIKQPDIIQQIYLRQLQIVLNPQQPPPPQSYLVVEEPEATGYRIPPYVLSETVSAPAEDIPVSSSKKKAVARGRKN